MTWLLALAALLLIFVVIPQLTMLLAERLFGDSEGEEGKHLMERAWDAGRKGWLR